jgi:hypothetical protein
MTMASSEALLGTSSGNGVLAVADGSCKVTTAEVVARPVCQVPTAQESLEFLSLDQVKTVSLSLNPLGALIEILDTPVPQKRVRGYDPLHLSDLGSHIDTMGRVTVISLFQGSWHQMKQTRSWFVRGSSLTNSA